jgi:hypothetical protein
MNENNNSKLDDYKHGLHNSDYCFDDCSNSSGVWDTTKNYVILIIGMIILGLTLIFDDELGG